MHADDGLAASPELGTAMQHGSTLKKKKKSSSKLLFFDIKYILESSSMNQYTTTQLSKTAIQ